MGFFSKLTEKKTCAICGKELGLLGKTKLSDGYLCKDDAGRLSPFFTGARQATVEDIQDQLVYRDTNKQLVSAFSPTRELGGTWRVLIDDRQGELIVTNQRDWRLANPDVLAFGDVISSDVRIDEDRSEVYRTDKDGKRQSYNPPRYEYSYDFWVTIRVRNPYFDTIRFKVNDWSVDDRYSADYDRCQRNAYEITNALNALKSGGQQQPYQQQYQGQQPYQQGGYATQGSYQQPAQQALYQQQGGCQQSQPQSQAQQASQQPQQASAQQATTPAFCPSCGAPTTPGARFCESCGSRLA